MNYSEIVFVGAIIKNLKGEFLLQKRDNNPALFPLCWTLFGGKVEKNETQQASILRELGEEIALNQDQINSITTFKSYFHEGNVKQVIYLIITNAKVIDLKLNEGERMEFVSPSRLFKRKFAFNIKTVLQDHIQSVLNP